MEISSCQSTVLGKRKSRRVDENLVLRLTSPISTPPNPSHSESKPSTSSVKAPILTCGTSVTSTEKRYRCAYHGCEKAYSKPSRLEEHERSHNGKRPFVCETCGKSYLRDTHLHAHARSHLPNEMRPFTCDKEGCGKKFWTSQHLRVHLSWHDGAKPYYCQETGCKEAFAKHHQLRAHTCATHAPPGTKPYRCEHEGCLKSFNTNQHLRAHQKTHDAKRYTCTNPSCLSGPEERPRYFGTWSSLQDHIKKDHPPICPHPSCKGKTFSNPGNLRAHLKLHELWKAEADLQKLGETDGEAPATKKRRGGEYGREWKCQMNGCDKDYKSEKALRIHINVEHQSRRDFRCTHDDCTRTFGYKHLLQRHIANVHSSGHQADHFTSSDEPDMGTDEALHEGEDELSIDLITGNAYAKQAEANLKAATVLRCPHPDLDGLLDAEAQSSMAQSSTIPRFCDYVFSRGYDLRRHLGSTHNVVVSRDVVDRWVKRKKQCREPSG